MSRTQSRYIEQKPTITGVEATIRGTRVAVRHVAAFLKAGYRVEEIVETGLPHLPPAAIHEAVAYYGDYRDEADENQKEGLR